MADITRPPGGVEAFLERLDHPLKADIVAVRAILLGADPRITEAVKWNAPSFRTTEFFATFHLRARDAVRLVFHTGAKKRATPVGLAVPDPEGLLTWLGEDRAMVDLGAGPAIPARRPAFEAIVRAWIAAM